MKLIAKCCILAIILAFTGCKAAKKVTYVEEAETIPQDVLSQFEPYQDPVIKPGDLLNITVLSTNMAAVAPFNKGMYVGEDGSVNHMQRSNVTNGNNQAANTDYYLVSQDGTIEFPGLGTLKVVGKTKAQLASEITDDIYPKYVTEKPNVEVRLMNFRVVVIGAVGAPGIIRSETETLNFFEALAQAGDLNIKGERENILLYRVNSDGTREVHRLNIHDKNFLLSPYFNLQQNDIIYVEPNSSLKHNSWGVNPAVTLTLGYIGTLMSFASFVIGIVNLTKK